MKSASRSQLIVLDSIFSGIINVIDKETIKCFCVGISLREGVLVEFLPVFG